jgi:FRG domain
MERFEVADVREAIELAYRLRAEGRYDWFRGQLVDLPPYSSALRIGLQDGTEAYERNKRRIKRFLDWVSATPQLLPLLKSGDAHSLSAILQHYGIATHYLDFTTDPGVAGFFACDTNHPPAATVSCIYCLNSLDLAACWDSVRHLESRRDMKIERVVVDVSNLWRLEAQAGVFLYVNYNWDVDYPMDRIVFPYTGYPPAPTRERIYPQARSFLEQMLDQYFDLDQSVSTNEKVREWLASRGDEHGQYTITGLPRRLYEEAFDDASTLTTVASWSESAIEAWLTIPNERFLETVGRSLELQLGADSSASGIMGDVRFGIAQSLRFESSLRTLDLQFRFASAPGLLNTALLSDLLRRAWNGMRALPFPAEDIAECLGRVAALHVLGFADMSYDEQERCLEAHMGRVKRVEFGPPDGASTQAWASMEDLVAAVRPDMRALLKDQYRARVEDPSKLFTLVQDPRLIFDFEPFRRLFARSLIATQVLDRRRFIHFNPATVFAFGNP